MQKCILCRKNYRCPKLLPCFHSFCLRCVEENAGGGPSFTCPTCATVTVLPPGGAKDLQANIYLEKDLAQNQSRSKQPCELCAKGEKATHKCVECQQVYCPPCRRTHDTIRCCTSHTVLPLTAEEDAESAEQRRCPKHTNQFLLLFCRQCETSICIQCKLTSHDGHETEDVVDTGKKARDELTKEVSSVSRQEQVLNAILKRSQDFEEDLHKERKKIEENMSSRANELREMVDKAQREAVDNVVSITERAVNELKEKSVPVREKHNTTVAKREHIGQMIETGEDIDAVGLLVHMKAEADQAEGNTSGKSREDVMVERGTARYEFRSRAVKYSDVLAFIGLAREGPILRTKALSMDAESLQESIRPGPQNTADSLFTFRKHRMSNGETPSFTEIVYSRNPKSTLAAIHLTTSDDMLWLNFNPGGNVPMFALFDDEGQMMEAHSENIPTSAVLVSCADDTVASMTNGRWVKPGNESGVLDNFSPWGAHAVSKSSTQLLLKATSIHCLLSTDMPPQINPNPAYTVNVGGNAFDVSADGRFFAIANGNNVNVFDKTTSSNILRNYAGYVEPSGQGVTDVCFCFVEGEEMLLVAYSTKNTVHIVDHKDGCYFVGTLETDQCPLNAPCHLATNHKGRAWVGCNGGKVIIFDV